MEYNAVSGDNRIQTFRDDLFTFKCRWLAEECQLWTLEGKDTSLPQISGILVPFDAVSPPRTTGHSVCAVRIIENP